MEINKENIDKLVKYINIELKKNTFRFFNNCNKYENAQLLKNMIRTSNNIKNENCI